MLFCNNCGAPISDARASHCPACGAARSGGNTVRQQPRVPRPSQTAAAPEAPVRTAPARGLQTQYILLAVLALLVVALVAATLYLTRERPTEPGTIVYADAPAAENEADANTAAVKPTAAPAQQVTPQPASQPSVQTPAPAASGAVTWRGFAYHVPSGFAEVASGSSDVRTYYNESLNMTITVTVLDTADPYGTLERSRAAFDSDASLRTTYSDGRDNWFVRSGYDGNGWVFYSKEKVYTDYGNTFASIDFSYPNDAQKSTRDAILTSFVNDFGLA